MRNRALHLTNRFKPFCLLLAAAVLLTCVPVRAQGSPPDHQGSARLESQLNREVYHQLELMPFYTVFDNLQYKVSGSQVTLFGQVNDPQLKNIAESSVKSIEGVTKVINNIQVLPPFPADSRLRRALYRAIYDDPQLQKYGEGNLLAIHIIVDDGQVTLVGVVNSQSDKLVAGMKANAVPGIFSVTNDLVVQPGGAPLPAER